MIIKNLNYYKLMYNSLNRIYLADKECFKWTNTNTLKIINSLQKNAKER